MNEFIMKLLRPLWARCVLQLWRWNLGGYKVRCIYVTLSFEKPGAGWKLIDDVEEKLNFMFDHRWKLKTTEHQAYIVLQSQEDLVALKLAATMEDGLIF